MYTIESEIPLHPEAGRELIGKRSGLRAAFALARKAWREFRGTAVIVVSFDGAEIARDPCEFLCSAKKWHTTHRHLPH